MHAMIYDTIFVSQTDDLELRAYLDGGVYIVTPLITDY